MNDRISKELDLLRKFFPKLEYVEDGQWVLIKDFTIPHNVQWNCQSINTCFQIPLGYPGTPPDGFYVPSGTNYKGDCPGNYKEPAANSPPFLDNWGFLSWHKEAGWKATSDLQSGSNLLNFVRTFTDRFAQGV